MHRVNFAQCSGVVVDVCREHGTWFDRDELMHIVQFIRAGGLELSRDRRRAELAEEERRVRRMRQASANVDPANRDQLADSIRAAGSVLRLLLPVDS
jgi:Zn-finger nucleic acid-binding protein